MPASDEEYARICQEDLEFTGPPGPGERFISYRLTPEERPRGMDVRFVVKVVSGRKAQELNALQTEAIMELLLWCRDHREQQEQAGQDRTGPVPLPVSGPGQQTRECPPEMR